MPTAEAASIPDWARQERAADRAWIADHLPTFWPAAQRGYAAYGRGAVVVDATTHASEAGVPFFYLREHEVEELQDADALRLVKAYDPTWELVAMLFKREQRLSAYRVGVPSAIRQACPPDEVTHRRVGSIRSEDILKAEQAETLQKADRGELSCPRCGFSLGARMVVSEIPDLYEGVQLFCGTCGFQEF